VKGRELIDGSTQKTIISAEEKVRCEAAGYSTIAPTEFILGEMERAIRDRAELFLTTYCLDNLRTSSPQLVDAACQRIGTPTILRVLEGMLMEGLSIRDLRGICESLLAIDSVTTVDQSKFIVFFPPLTNICAVRQEKTLEALDDLDYLNCARMSMKSYFSAKHTTDGTLIVYLIDPQLEQRIARADVDPLTEDERQRLLAALEAEIGSLPVTVKLTTILTTVEARHQLWTLIEREFRRYPVLTYTELSPELNIQPIARINTD
jgi:type III secretion protein V